MFRNIYANSLSNQGIRIESTVNIIDKCYTGPFGFWSIELVIIHVPFMETGYTAATLLLEQFASR